MQAREGNGRIEVKDEVDRELATDVGAGVQLVPRHGVAGGLISRTQNRPPEPQLGVKVTRDAQGLTGTQVIADHAVREVAAQALHTGNRRRDDRASDRR